MSFREEGKTTKQHRKTKNKHSVQQQPGNPSRVTHTGVAQLVRRGHGKENTETDSRNKKRDGKEKEGGGVHFRLLLISGFVLRSEAPAALATPRGTRRLFFRVVG